MSGHRATIERDGIRYWHWSCSCGAKGASFTTPFAAKQSLAKYHPAAACDTITKAAQ